MNSTELLGIVLPSCYPDRALAHIFSDESLSNMKELVPYATFLINFQSPWTEEEINQSLSQLNKHNFKVKYVYNEYQFKKNIVMTKIRDDAAQLLDCDYYVIVDDDFRFGKGSSSRKSGGRQYLDALHYMVTHPKCGIVSMRKGPIKWYHNVHDEEVPKGHIHPTPYVCHYRTGHGLFVKSLKGISEKGKFYPNDSFDAYGSGEEKILAGHVLNQGLYPARTTNTNLSNTPQCGCPHTSFGTSYGVDSYIKEMLNKDYVGYLGSNLVQDSTYKEKGGLIYSEEVVNKYGVNYNEISYEQIISDLNLYISNK